MIQFPLNCLEQLQREKMFHLNTDSDSSQKQYKMAMQYNSPFQDCLPIDAMFLFLVVFKCIFVSMLYSTNEIYFCFFFSGFQLLKKKRKKMFVFSG